MHAVGMQQRHADLTGLWVPIVTPFTTADELDAKGIKTVAHRVLTEGARGLVALGTTGEPATLTFAERASVIGLCDEISGRHDRPLIVGTGTYSTRDTVAATVALGQYSSVAAALVVVPYYTRPSIDGIVEHYRVVAAESPVPIIAYNVPYRTGRTLTAGDLLRLAQLPNVIGVKQAVGALDTDTLELLASAPDTFQVLAGDDAFLAPTVLLGGVGAIAAAANVCTAIFADLIDAALDGDVTRSRCLAHALLPVVQAGFAEPNPACWKAVLYHRGEIATPDLRPPMAPAPDEAARRLVTAVAAVHERYAHGCVGRTSVAPTARHR